MKKKFTYVFLVAGVAIALGLIGYRYQQNKIKKEATLYSLKDREGAAANLPEWVSVKKQGKLLFARLQSDPTDDKSKLQLASMFIQEGRVTGDHGYYDKAALKYVGDILQKDSIHFEALLMRSIIEMSQHHFSEGLLTAMKAQSINPYNAFVYGLLVDGHVELGNYSAAVENSDKMISIRPDLRSYSRISYLREIHGDLPGAIEAMKLAVDAGAPGDEGTEWCRVQLGKLYHKTGDTAQASMQYELSMQVRPDYPYAVGGMASIETERKNYNKAIVLYKQASSSVNDISLQEELAETYEQSGSNKEAKAVREKVINELAGQSALALKDPTVGHYSDRELAYAYLAVNDFDKALEHAMMEYNRRPENIDVNELVAWVHYRRGEYVEGIPFLSEALKTHSSNPTLLARATLLYRKAHLQQLAASIQSTNLLYNSSIPLAIRKELAATGLAMATPVVHQ